MARKKFAKKRSIETRNQNIGHIILFCEGYTEENYFSYLKTKINKNNKFNRITIQLVNSKGGTARKVLNYANKFLNNNTKYMNYEKYLVFDCDKPPDIQQVIIAAIASSNNYKLLVSNTFFETWLLMHFENNIKRIDQQTTYRILEEHLSITKGKYKSLKNDKIITKAIKVELIKNAIEEAKSLEKRYKHDALSIEKSIERMNPYSNVYVLVEQFMNEME